MKKKFCRKIRIRYEFWVIVIIGIIVTGIIFYIIHNCFNSFNRVKLLEGTTIGLIGGYITFALGYINYIIAHDKLFKELFQEFNCKYDRKFNNRLNQIVDNNEFDESKDTPLIVDYLNLCAEEYLWNSKGRIEPKVWKNWRNGMNYYFKNEVIRKIALKEIKKNNDSYYDFFNKEFPNLIEEAKRQ